MCLLKIKSCGHLLMLLGKVIVLNKITCGYIFVKKNNKVNLVW